MIIGTAEGDRTRYEIVLMSDGFIVRARSLETGEVFGSRDRLFRTAPAAFAYAEKSALRDAEDCIAAGGMERLEAKIASDRAARVFNEIRDQLADKGVGASLINAWDRAADTTFAASLN